ncbi:hypothetical protein [Deinococcus sp.]|uniref:hypothetical protein n=1 Tax=Deinococcus sp. TaxID=47478 RepID=UPI003C7E8AC6
MNRRYWQRRAMAAAVAGLVSVGLGGGGTTRIAIPINDYQSPTSREIKMIDWNYKEITSMKPSNGFVMYYKDNTYLDYRKGNDQVIKVGNYYYQTGGQFDCRTHPLIEEEGIFYESCGNLIDKNLRS